MSRIPGDRDDRARAASVALWAAILLTVVIPRLVMIHVSVIDWDESIYALIAQQWLADGTAGELCHTIDWSAG